MLSFGMTGREQGPEVPDPPAAQGAEAARREGTG
jgi:hypothetical protein